MGTIRTVGLISDTHGLLRQEALRALEGSDMIIHAGDVGDPKILEELRRLARVVAGRGDIDTRAGRTGLAENAGAGGGAEMIYVLHGLDKLDVKAPAPGGALVVRG